MELLGGQLLHPQLLINRYNMKKLVISLIVLFVAVVLTVCISPFGILYGIIKSIYRRNLKYFSKILLRIAVALDQLGNVTCGGLLDVIFTKEGNNFGLEDDTVSEVLAKNQHNLTRFGRLISNLLEYIDPGHLESALTENEL